MCAIAGVIGHPQAAEWTAAMTEAQRHRGPDGAGLRELAPGAAFGHRRLAILDVSERGAQPMTSRDGRWTITLNGEIFNYLELRAELQPHPWRSETDTEVFLEAVAAWGLERALARSVGMFAVALWDHRERTLWLARDRIGEKPLVYFWDGATFAFASELKALERWHERRLDPAALDVYLGLGYVPAPLGVFRKTHKLPAGHWARLAKGTLDVQRWWFPEHAAAAPAADAEQRREQLRALMAEAVRLRLRADVPLALSLSGGVDSSVVAAELAHQGAAPEAFTVVFQGDSADLPYARHVATQLGLRHSIIPAGAGALAREVASAAEHYDEPFADSSAIACLALARAVAGRYKVILDGDGGDEAFGGYRHYEYIGAKQALKAAAAAVGLRDGAASATVYEQSKVLFSASRRAALLNGHGGAPAALDRLLATDAFLRAPQPSALKRALWSDRHLALANGLTYKMDIALSAHGVEGRAPLLDHRVLEWAQNLDDRDLVRGREKKVLLREAYAGRLPRTVLDRPKHGFGAPVAQWLAGPLRDYVADLLPCPLLDPVAQRQLSGQRQWAVFALAVWAKRWRPTW